MATIFAVQVLPSPKFFFASKELGVVFHAPGQHAPLPENQTVVLEASWVAWHI